MDLQNLKQQDVCEYTVETADGEKTDIVFILAGPAHQARLQYERRHWSRTARDFNKRGKAQVPEDADDVWEQTTEQLVAFTLGWRNLQDGGKDVPFSPEAARALYDNRGLTLLREQILTALKTAANFTRSSSSNSSPTSSNSAS